MEDWMNDLDELHQQLTHEIGNQRSRELADFIETKRAANQTSEMKAAQAAEQLAAMGFSADKLETLHSRLASDDAKELQAIRAKYVGETAFLENPEPEDFTRAARDAAFATDGTRDLPPSYAAVFSTKDGLDKLSGGT
jgi:hypothetical protein